MHWLVYSIIIIIGVFLTKKFGDIYIMHGITDPPQDVVLLATGSETLEISWEPPPMTGSGSGEFKILAYYIFCEYRMAKRIYGVDPEHNFTLELDSLTPHTTYNCCVIAHTNDGPSSLICDTQTTLSGVLLLLL